ncbi:hypothetical protein DBV08_18435 [Rhodococcus sp. KBW08]|uniref:hypothetical protein n=1 Tax=Rhodococcus sp. KBW08 TaxID=2144188 RepID=UPI000F5980BF|nr:hypothetical protein [Rhodococcus sp. KBW08]RQO45849.1 hypothetical protein DBV08_18435 [Rhodococcus sp. KBW08]
MQRNDPLGRINSDAVEFFSRWANRMAAAGLLVAGVGWLLLFTMGEQDVMASRAWVVLPAVALLLGGAAFLIVAKSKTTDAR